MLLKVVANDGDVHIVHFMRVFKNRTKPSFTCARQCESKREGAHSEGREEKITKMALAGQFEGGHHMSHYWVVRLLCPSSTPRHIVYICR